MLDKTRRIKKEYFEELLKKGKSAFSPLLSVKYLSNRQGKSIFGFVISSKVAKKATERNLFKRRCRHIIKKNLPLIKDGLTLSFFAKPGVTKLSFAELENEITLLLRRLLVFSNKY
ncbi:MAG: ribonuclease P protein component [bacterium]